MEDRITNLEIKFSLQDDLLDTLNRMVATQQMQIERLQQAVRDLNMRILQMESSRPMSPGDEVPPHY